MEVDADTVGEVPVLVLLLVEAGAPLEASLDEVAPEDSADADAPAAGVPPSVAAGAGALDPPLKSVTYQPEPLSWKPAAVSCLVKAVA